MQYSRIMRLAGTLTARDFLFLNPNSGRYSLGPSLYRLGQMLAPRYRDLAAAARPILRSLVAATEKTAMFSIPNGTSRLVLCKQEPSTTLRYTVDEGQARPMAWGASGRVMMAFGAEHLRRRVLEAINSESAKELTDRLPEIRDRGFDVSVSELTKGAFAIAVPAVSAEGDLIGVLTLAGPSDGLTEEDRAQYLALLHEHVRLFPGVRAVAPANS